MSKLYRIETENDNGDSFEFTRMNDDDPRCLHQSPTWEVYNQDGAESVAPAMWILNLRPGYQVEHLALGIDRRNVIDEDGQVIGTIGPGSHFFDSKENAAAYRESLGPELERALVLAPVLMLAVNFGEDREGLDA